MIIGWLSHELLTFHSCINYVHEREEDNANGSTSPCPRTQSYELRQFSLFTACQQVFIGYSNTLVGVPLTPYADWVASLFLYLLRGCLSEFACFFFSIHNNQYFQIPIQPENSEWIATLWIRQCKFLLSIIYWCFDTLLARRREEKAGGPSLQCKASKPTGRALLIAW